MPSSYFSSGLTALDAGDFAKADAYFTKTLEILPNSLPTLSNLLFCKFQQRKFADIVEIASRVIKLDEKNIDAYQALALAHKELSQHGLALDFCDEVLSLDPRNIQAMNNKGVILNNLGRHEEAIASLTNALALNPRMADAFVNKGNAQRSLRKFADAISSFDQALSIKADLEGAWVSKAHLLADLKRYHEAIPAYDRALSIKPSSEGAWIGRGNVFLELGRYEEASAAYDRALSIKIDSEAAWLGRGNVLYALKRHSEALVAYDKALSINPRLAAAWFGRGNTFAELARYDEAFIAYDKTKSIEPDLAGNEGARLHAKMHLCNWERLDAEIGNLTASIRSGKPNCQPFVMLSLSDLPGDHLRCAKAWAMANSPQTPKPVRQGPGYKHDRIRIGYVSPDFRTHAVGHLSAGVFEHHNRARFETHAFSIGPDDNSELQRRLEKSFDRFYDFDNRSDDDVVNAVRSAEIDILVDLAGYTQGARPSLLGGRPAPIQVSYLGYPGTMGVDFVDYMIGDRVVFKDADAGDFAEKLVSLPNSFIPYDVQHVENKLLKRKEFHLPDDKFVFCCFNNNNKILPEVFASWMHILEQVGDGSVIWLFASSQQAKENLKREAAERGVDPVRLVFADRVALSEHLARHRLADLFLDTLPHNAITTAGDALWAGLPVLTRTGQSFASRGAASLLQAVGLPELITHSREEYESLAVELALDRERMNAIKENLSKNKLTAPLFNVSLYTKNLEAAYEAMYRRYGPGCRRIVSRSTREECAISARVRSPAKRNALVSA